MALGRWGVKSKAMNSSIQYSEWKGDRNVSHKIYLSKWY